MSKARLSRVVGPSVLTTLLLGLATVAFGDKVVLKNGVMYRGSVDRDNTIVWVFDGLKRVVVRDSKIAKFEPDSTFGNWENFKLVQPLVKHAGVMPKEAFDIKISPWNDRGRRSFSYVSARSNKPVSMEQAIYEMGPYLVKLRGVDGFWQEGRLSTTQVPREVVVGLLGKVERKNLNERRRVASFLIQAGWYDEANAELDALGHDFPDEPGLNDTLANAHTVVSQLVATQRKAEIDVRRQAQQYREVAKLLKTFPTKDVSSDLLVDVRDQIRKDEAQGATDKAMADDLRALADRLPSGMKAEWKKPMLEVIQALTEVPDVVRDRLVAWQKAKAEANGKDEALFALAMSGFVVGSDAAAPDLSAASTFWKMRAMLQDYLAGDASSRGETLEQLQSLTLPDDTSQAGPAQRLDLLTRLAIRMAPPLADQKQKAKAGDKPTLHRVPDDGNEVPTEYAVSLPPEYHPLRSYPTVVALHGGGGPQSAIDWWAAEASRRGYIVIAPEYNLPDRSKEYGYSGSEHAAVELALRDARRRYAIDSDRVFLGGQLSGGDMAWDFGSAHPDLFAGMAIVSGRPFKYAFRYLSDAEGLSHAEQLPVYVAIGDLAPAGTELVFGSLLKRLIASNFDITYVEYFRRGLEDFPEEAPAIFDWMDRRRRDPAPKKFEVKSARESDSRFYGVVIREFEEGRTTAPEAVEPLGKNLNPATIRMRTSSISNLLQFQIAGLRRLDIWVNPKLIDFKRKMEVRVNGKAFFKGMAKPNVEPFLEDLRIRGDRQQVYWLKVPIG